MSDIVDLDALVTGKPSVASGDDPGSAGRGTRTTNAQGHPVWKPNDNDALGVLQNEQAKAQATIDDPSSTPFQRRSAQQDLQSTTDEITRMRGGKPSAKKPTAGPEADNTSSKGKSKPPAGDIDLDALVAGKSEPPKKPDQSTAESKRLGTGTSADIGGAAQAKRLVRALGGTVDLVAGAIPMTLGVATDAAVYATDIALGKDHKEATHEGLEASKSVQNNEIVKTLGSPVKSAIQHFYPEESEPYSKNAVNGALDKISKWIDKGEDYVVDKTGGKVSKEDAQTISNWLQVMAPAKIGEVAHTVFKRADAAKPGVPGQPGDNLHPDVTTPYQERARQMDETAMAEANATEYPNRMGDGNAPPTDGMAPPRAQNEVGDTNPPPDRKIGEMRDHTTKTRLPDDPTIIGDKTPLPTAKPIYTGAPSSLDSALAKARAGKMWDLTSEERIALRNQGTAPQMAGKADLTLLGIIAMGGTGLALANAYPDKSENAMAFGLAGSMFLPGHGKGISLEDIVAKPDAAPLGSILKDSNYTLGTLEALPQNRFVFNKQTVRDLANRQTTPKAEKEVIEHALSRDGNDTISAKELMVGVKEATHDFELTPKETDQYADHGLGEIERPEKDQYDFEERLNPTNEQHPLKASTTLWRMPEGVGYENHDNHFNDTQYFAHTRGFEEDGVHHVVELQSDLANRAGGGFKREQEFIDGRRQYEKDQGHKPDGGMVQETNEMQRKLDQQKTLTKNYDKRLVREELARAARKGDGEVRFATADTVAKVEGWPDRQVQLEELEHSLEGIKGNPRKDTLFEQRLEDKIDYLKNLIKTEGRFRPEHQGLYNRYARDTTKFLKQLGAKEIMDDYGHTWLETPTGLDKIHGGGGKRAQMFGRADPELLLKMGLVVGGGLGAAYLANQDKLEAALAGGLVGLLASRAPDYARATAVNWKGALGTATGVSLAVGAGVALDKEHPIEGALVGLLWGASKGLPKATLTKVNGVTIDDLANGYNGAVAARQREVANVSAAIRTLVPDSARREQLAQIIESGRTGSLSGNERAAAQTFRGFMDSWGTAAKNNGLIEDFIQDYVPHVVEKQGLPKSKGKEVLDALFGDDRNAATGGTAHNKERKYDTFADLQKALQNSGLKVKTMDVADVLDLYGRSMGKAIERKTFIDNLHQAYDSPTIPRRYPYIMDSKNAPSTYKTVDSPQMRGKAVHPELEEPLKFLLERDNPGAVRAGLVAASTATKRLSTSLSLFHASNLLNAYIGANGLNVFKGSKPITAALDMWRKGGNGDVLDLGIRNGLKMETPMEFQQNALETVGKTMDSFIPTVMGKKIPLFQKTLGSIEGIQKNTFDKITWDYLHTGMKAATFTRAFEKLTLKNPGLPKEEVARQAASFVNDTFGGLDWYRVATETQSGLARKLALSSLSPKGRSVLQIGMFAPDWTFSTFRSMYKALPGATSMPLTQGLHQAYVLRTAMLYLTVMNGYNMAVSGHPIWDNHNRDGSWDPLRIHYADGTTQQVAKHATEGPEWLINPRQTALNKLGFAIKEPAEYLLGKEYLRAEGSSPPMKSRTAHALGSVAPIALSGGGVEGRSLGEQAKRAALSAVGLPVYGLSDEEMKAGKAERKAHPPAKKSKKKEAS